MTDVAESVGAVTITDDRVAMTADGDVDVYLDEPDSAPLSAGERHATMWLTGEGFRAELELDADGVAALASAFADLEHTDVEQDE